MIRCKDVSKALFNKNYEDLTKAQRLKLMVHVVLCPFCGRFHRDVVKVHKVNKAFSTNENIGEDALPDEELPEDSKVRMRAVLKEEMDKKDDV